MCQARQSKEYIISRNRNDKLIVVIKRDDLFGQDFFEGFRQQEEIDYESRILNKFEYMAKKPAEKNPAYKQPIGYSLVVDRAQKKVFAYQRPYQDSRYSEKRLQGKWSWGIGGHIDKHDVKTGNPIHASVLRELEEEINIGDAINLKRLGYINNEDEVGRVHFGILHVVETETSIMKAKDPEIDNGRMRTIEELSKLCVSSDFLVEEWSRICLGPLKEYLTETEF